MPFQKLRPVISNAYVASLQLTQQPGNMSPNLKKLEGYYEGGTQAWLMFFDSLGAPANGTAPLYSESLGTVAPNGYSWQYTDGIIMRLNSALASQPLVNGLIVCVSTTANTLTIGTGSNLSTFYVSLEEWETLPTGSEQQYGDTNTLVTALATVWATGTFHTIDKIIMKNPAAQPGYVKMFAKSPVAGDLPLLNGEWQLATSQALQEYNFRGVGFQPQSGTDNSGTATDGAPLYNGCYIACESVAGPYNGAAFQHFTLQVNYV